MEELYTLEREVGRGSYGVVFEGRAAHTGQRVAIKRLPCRGPEGLELYLQELWAMRATAGSHANVIALHACLLQTGPRTLKPLTPGTAPRRLVESVLKGRAAWSGTDSLRGESESTTPRRPGSRGRKRPAPRGEEQEEEEQEQEEQEQEEQEQEEQEEPAPRCVALWLVMEFCDGGDLNRYLLSRPPDCGRNLSAVRQLCSAVAFLHRLGITHRDLKPDNLLVLETQGGPVVKVADFGLSRMSEGPVDGELSRQHYSSTCGSDFYMAPEVWGGRSYTARADIFSLGVVFWAVLERLTFLEEGAAREQLGAYVCRGRWLMPLGEALWENADLQLCIPAKFKRTPPLPPPPGAAVSALLLAMLASDPEARPPADQLEARLSAALQEDAR